MKCDCCHKDVDKRIDVENDTNFDRGLFPYEYVCDDCANEHQDDLDIEETYQSMMPGRI